LNNTKAVMQKKDWIYSGWLQRANPESERQEYTCPEQSGTCEESELFSNSRGCLEKLEPHP